MQNERPLEDLELSRLALALARRFVQRWDLYARQLDDGCYICVHEPLNIFQLIAHLCGETTLGAYLLNRKSQERCAVYDAVDECSLRSLFSLSTALSVEGVPANLEGSRCRGHLGLFFLRQSRASRRGHSQMGYSECMAFQMWRFSRNRIGSAEGRVR